MPRRRKAHPNQKRMWFKRGNTSGQGNQLQTRKEDDKVAGRDINYKEAVESDNKAEMYVTDTCNQPREVRTRSKTGATARKKEEQRAKEKSKTSGQIIRLFGANPNSDMCITQQSSRVRVFTCDHCSSMFISESAYEAHKRTHLTVTLRTDSMIAAKQPPKKRFTITTKAPVAHKKPSEDALAAAKLQEEITQTGTEDPEDFIIPAEARPMVVPSALACAVPKVSQRNDFAPSESPIDHGGLDDDIDNEEDDNEDYLKQVFSSPVAPTPPTDIFDNSPSTFKADSVGNVDCSTSHRKSKVIEITKPRTASLLRAFWETQNKNITIKEENNSCSSTAMHESESVGANIVDVAPNNVFSSTGDISATDEIKQEPRSPPADSSAPENPLGGAAVAATESQQEYFCIEPKVELQLEEHAYTTAALQIRKRRQKCPFCSESFLETSELQAHVVVHVTEKPHACDTCGERFTLMETLVQHKRIHAEIDRRCPHCDASFLLVSDLRQHLKSHVGPKPYVCTYCDTGFATGAELKVHMRSHTGKDPILNQICDLCGGKFEPKMEVVVDKSQKPYVVKVVRQLKTCCADHKKTKKKGTKQEAPKLVKGCSKVDLNTCAVKMNEKDLDEIHKRTKARSTSHVVQISSKSSIMYTKEPGVIKINAVPLDWPNPKAAAAKAKDQNDGVSAPGKDSKDSTTYQGKDSNPAQSTDSSQTEDTDQGQTKVSNVLPKDLPTQTEPQSYRSSTFKPYKCKYCGKGFNMQWDMRQHIRIHTGRNFHECTICFKRFYQMTQLTRHIRTHTGENPYKCTFKGGCGKSFRQPYQLTEHHESHHATRPFVCQHCGREFSEREKWRKHQRDHINVGPHVCPECGLIFVLRKNLVSHLAKHTGQKRMYKYKCNVCEKVLNTRSALRDHQASHLGVKNYPCTLCSAKFAHKTTLKYHIKKHKGESRFLCSLCGKSFNRHYAFASHMRRHSGEKPFVCETCGKKFCTKRGLQTHTVIHTGLKPHNCPYPDCGKSFTMKGNLKLHLKIHTRGDLLRCQDCPRTFVTEKALEKHAKKHIPHQCKYCGKLWKSASKLKRHMTQVHKAAWSDISSEPGSEFPAPPPLVRIALLNNGNKEENDDNNSTSSESDWDLMSEDEDLPNERLLGGTYTQTHNEMRNDSTHGQSDSYKDVHGQAYFRSNSDNAPSQSHHMRSLPTQSQLSNHSTNTLMNSQAQNPHCTISTRDIEQLGVHTQPSDLHTKPRVVPPLQQSHQQVQYHYTTTSDNQVIPTYPNSPSKRCAQFSEVSGQNRHGSMPVKHAQTNVATVSCGGTTQTTAQINPQKSVIHVQPHVQSQDVQHSASRGLFPMYQSDKGHASTSIAYPTTPNIHPSHCKAATPTTTSYQTGKATQASSTPQKQQQHVIRLRKQADNTYVTQEMQANSVCVYCGMRFVKVTDLMAHVKQHTGQEVYSCGRCGKAFMKQSYLDRHQCTGK